MGGGGIGGSLAIMGLAKLRIDEGSRRNEPGCLDSVETDSVSVRILTW